MTGLRIELRRGPAVLAAPVLLALGALAATGMVSSWTTWNNFSQGVAASLRLMGPAAAAVAALAGLRFRRNGTRQFEQLSVRGPQAVVLAELGAVLAWTLAALTVLVAGFAVATAGSAVWGRPSFAWLVETYAALSAHAVAGYVAGRLLPYLLTPLLVAALTYLANAVLLSRPDRWFYFLSLLNVQYWLPFDAVNSAALLLQTVWLAGLSLVLVAVALAAAKERRAATGRWLVGGVVLALAGVIGLRVDDGGFWTLNTKIEWVCSGAAPQICLHPAFAPSRSALTEQFTAVQRRLGGTPFAFDRIEQRPRGVGSQPNSGTAVAFALDDPEQTDYADAVVGLAANALTGGQQCTQTAPDAAGPSAQSISLEQVVVAWAASDARVIPDDAVAQEHAGWFNALSAQARQAWLRRHAEAVRRCSLVPADFR